MLIQSLIKRDGGTKVNMDGKVAEGIMVGGVDYHFKPNKAGDHVCDVKDKVHAKRFLQIPEGFEPYLPEDKADVSMIVGEVPPKPPEPAELPGDAPIRVVGQAAPVEPKPAENPDEPLAPVKA